jgi:hypothetical protein
MEKFGEERGNSSLDEMLRATYLEQQRLYGIWDGQRVGFIMPACIQSIDCERVLMKSSISPGHSPSHVRGAIQTTYLPREAYTPKLTHGERHSY